MWSVLPTSGPSHLPRRVTAEALGEIVLEAKSELVGLGFVVEKSFMEGRARLETHGWRVESVAIVTSLEDGMVSVLDRAVSRD